MVSEYAHRFVVPLLQCRVRESGGRVGHVDHPVVESLSPRSPPRFQRGRLPTQPVSLAV
jgi:hypothetical protein